MAESYFTDWRKGDSQMGYWGEDDPRRMPTHFFMFAVGLDFSTAVRANIDAQNFTVCPRHWYVDARFYCTACDALFQWPAHEQKAWFERYKFYVDSQPTLCGKCRARRRRAVQLKKENDAMVGPVRKGGTIEQKQRVVEIVDELEDYYRVIPNRMRETRALFLRQLSRDQK